MCRFLKFIPSEEALYLARKYPNAFILLMFIAERARRENGHPDGLTVGQCHIGDHKFYGLTERKYRTAKDILCMRKIIRIVETCRTRQKSTTGTTTLGTLVELLDSRIWNISSNINDDRSDDRPTTDRRPTDEEQEGKRKKKKEKEYTTPTPSKIKFRELVELTQTEYDSLLAKNGQEHLNLMLDTLDAYKGSTGKKYDSDFHTMKQGGWVVNRVQKELLEQKKSNEKPFRNSSAIPPGNSPGAKATKFEGNRVLRGSNSVEGDQGVLHE